VLGGGGGVLCSFCWGLGGFVRPSSPLSFRVYSPIPTPHLPGSKDSRMGLLPGLIDRIDESLKRGGGVPLHS